MQGCGRSSSGCRSVRVPMLLARSAGSIGMGLPLRPVAELANPVNRPGSMVALECRSGPTAPRNRVGSAPTLPRTEGSASPPYAPPAHTDSGAGRGRLQADRWAGHRLGCCRRPRSLTSVGGLVPAPDERSPKLCCHGQDGWLHSGVRPHPSALDHQLDPKRSCLPARCRLVFQPAQHHGHRRRPGHGRGGRACNSCVPRGS